MTMPSYTEWISSTNVKLKKRSTLLQRVDRALKQYDMKETAPNFTALKQALTAWQKEQDAKKKPGKDWKHSIRNQNGMVTQLDRAIKEHDPAGVDKRVLRPEEAAALQYVAEAQGIALIKQFQTARVAFKSQTLMGIKASTQAKFQQFKARHGRAGSKAGPAVGTPSSAGEHASNFASAAKQGHDMALDIKGNINDIRKFAGKNVSGKTLSPIKKIEDKVLELCTTIADGECVKTIFKQIGLPNPVEFAKQMAPIIGAVTSGISCVSGWIDVARTAVRQSQIKQTRAAFAPGDPEAAFDAILVLLKRELSSKTAQNAISTAAFAVKTAGSFGDLGCSTGPAAGLAEMIAHIVQTVIEYVRDIKEARAANELLKLGSLNMEIFQSCPILGCYFLAVQDHSTIINFAVKDYGTANFVFDAERLIKKINPVLEQAQQYIQASRLEVPGFAESKGVVGQSSDLKGVFGTVLGNHTQPLGLRIRAKKEQIVDSMTNSIAKARNKPVVSTRPKVAPGRIAGISSR